MFTIRREREKKHAQGYITKPEDVERVHQVIDAVHDVLEGVLTADASMPILSAAFVEGGPGVWEQAGAWIRKLASEYPVIGAVWVRMARDQSSRIRFRVAAFLDEMPPSVRAEIFPLLLNDPSPKVRSKVAADRGSASNPNDLELLAARRAVEKDPTVLASIDYALSTRKPGSV